MVRLNISEVAEVKTKINIAKMAVINSLNPVRTPKESSLRACFPRTVELPQQKEANNAHRDAMSVLSLHGKND